MKKLLVVEDELRTLRVLQRSLKRRGYVVKAAANAGDAINIGCRFRPDVLLTDWLLKGEQNGLDVATVLRQLYPKLPIVFVTGLPVAALRAASRHLTHCVFLEKPVRLQQIEAAMAQSIEQARHLFRSESPEI